MGDDDNEVGEDRLATRRGFAAFWQIQCGNVWELAIEPIGVGKVYRALVAGQGAVEE